MELVIEARNERLKKMYADKGFHGWIVNDPWIKNKWYREIITDEYKKVSYITEGFHNPLPFHANITYVGVLQVN